MRSPSEHKVVCAFVPLKMKRNKRGDGRYDISLHKRVSSPKGALEEYIISRCDSMGRAQSLVTCTSKYTPGEGNPPTFTDTPLLLFKRRRKKGAARTLPSNQRFQHLTLEPAHATFLLTAHIEVAA
jgi:hypothetical protein